MALLGALNAPARVPDQLIADLADEDGEARGRVVVLGVLPDEHGYVHERPELGGELGEGRARVHPAEGRLERGEVLCIIARLRARGRDFLRERVEGRVGAGLAQLEHAHHLAHLCAGGLCRVG